MKLKNSLLKLIFTTLLISTTQLSFAQDYSKFITEEYLRSEFTFKEGVKLKHAKCGEMTYPTCKYVWDISTKKSEKRDAKRAEHGLAPDGNKMMIVYAKATKPAYFERVLATYKDAKAVEGIGTQAVWSQERKQLSLITDKHLIMHVNIEMKIKIDQKQFMAEMTARMQGKPIPKNQNQNDGSKEHAINIAKHILKQL